MVAWIATLVKLQAGMMRLGGTAMFQSVLRFPGENVSTVSAMRRMCAALPPVPPHAL